MYRASSGSRSCTPRTHPGRGAWLVAFACLFWAALPAHADVTRTDIQVAARALSFVSNPPTGKVRLGIVYAPGNSRSTQQAQALQGLLANGFQVGSLELQPVMVEAANIAAADVDLYFLTGHLSAEETPELMRTGTNSRTLCITTDITQVRSGTCVLGVRSQPKVEVLVNRAAASAQGITFSTVFRMMITEL